MGCQRLNPVGHIKANYCFPPPRFLSTYKCDLKNEPWTSACENSAVNIRRSCQPNDVDLEECLGSPFLEYTGGERQAEEDKDNEIGKGRRLRRLTDSKLTLMTK